MLVYQRVKHFLPYIGNVIIPTDELIFFRGVGIPPTRRGFDQFYGDFMGFHWDFQGDS